VFAVGVLGKVGAPNRVVDERYIIAWWVIAYEMIPAVWQGADQFIVAEPLELMQFQTSRAVNVLGCQGPATRIVEKYHTGPVFLFVLRLRRTEELDCLLRHVMMFDHLHREPVIA